jgi:hypothetical protein
MDNSLQGMFASSLGLSSAILTGTGIWTTPATKPWIAFRSIDVDVMVSGITAPNVSGVDYIVGKSLAAPVEFLGHFTQIQLATGAIQAFY